MITLQDCAIYLTAISTLVSAIYLIKQTTQTEKQTKEIEKQTNLLQQEWSFKQPTPKVGIPKNPDFWHANSDIEIILQNTGNTDIVIQAFCLRNKAIEQVESNSVGGSSLIEQLVRDPVPVKNGEIYSFKFNTNSLPKQVPIYIQVRYTSSHNNYKTMEYYSDPETRVI